MRASPFIQEPVGPTPTATVGIFQTDILLMGALERIVQEYRANPGLIEDVLANLPQDSITANKYGKLTITQCKEWFAKTEIDVLLGLKFKYLEKSAVIAVELGDENENEATLGDKNYDTLESHPRKLGIKRAVESLHADVAYSISIFVSGEPELMLFLSSLILYGLFRRKEDLLDARGFVVSRYSMGSASIIEPGSKEQIFFRTIRLSGKVRHGWSKKEGGIIEAVPFAAITTPVEDSPFMNLEWENTDVLGPWKP